MSSYSRPVSTESRVVPGIGETITRSSPTRRFTSEDLPTFGRPTIAIRVSLRFSTWASGVVRISSAASSISAMPLPCSAEIGNTAFRPQRSNSKASASIFAVSTLLAATKTGLPVSRASSASSSSSGVMPARASTTRRINDAWSRAVRAWLKMFVGMRSLSSGIIPPVSTMWNRRPRRLRE